MDYVEKNNALLGAQWSLKKRIKVLDDLYRQYCLLTPYPYKPFIKSFRSRGEYEAWQKKQKNPWYR